MSLRRDLMVLVHFFNQSLWWLSSTFGPKRSRDGRSRCAWRLPWLWFFRWGCTALGTGRSNAFSRLIRCNFDRAGLSHSRTRECFEVHREHVSSNSIHRSTGLERKLVYWTTVPACHFCLDRWSRARTLSPTAISRYFANLSWLDFILSCWLAKRDPISSVTRDNRVRSSRCENSLAGENPVVPYGVLLYRACGIVSWWLHWVLKSLHKPLSQPIWRGMVRGN